MTQGRGAGLQAAHVPEFERFFRSNHRRTVTAVLALVRDFAEAEDVVQEAYERAARHWSDLRAYDDPAAWVRRVAYNLAINRLRRTRRAVRSHLFEWVGATQSEPDEGDPEVIEALRRLPPRYKVVLAMRYLWDFSTAEVAAELGLPANTVKQQLTRGRALLLAELNRGDGTTMAATTHVRTNNRG